MKSRLAKIIMVAATLVLLAAMAAGCGTQPAEEPAKEPATPALSGSLTIAGSTSVQPFSEVLAEEFTAKYPEVKINVQGGGSTQGIEAAKTGVADIGASSRELKPEEKGLKEFVIARDGIAVVVNPANKVDGLTAAQIKDIFLGKITNWKDVGGADAAITLVSREEGSGTRDGFEALVMNKEPVSDKAVVANSTGAVKTTVAGDVNAIGYMSMASLDKSVKALAVDGVAPSAKTVLDGSYKVSRPFIYLTKEEPTGVAKAFIDFVLSDEGQA
ncbi:MAG: phosphate ABC transporter substrate-binding protein, partial [Syntrophomonadaceae bacterium]|nr:phosphate ABC transporter substrate-binding protein [Syntrophomonadaceae bacterium]